MVECFWNYKYTCKEDMGLKRKKLLKQGACIAVCSTMLATGVTQLIPAYQAQSLVFADEVQQNIKKTTYTADKLTVDWGNAGYELTDGVWKVTFNNQYDQVKWRLPETVDMSTVKSVTFNVKDQKGSVSLKVYKNGDEDADGANTKYELTGADEYSISPTGEGDMVAVGLMTTDNAGSGSAISLVSVTVETDTTPKTPPEIEQNIEDWKKSVTSSDALGENAIAGTGIMLDEIKDNTLMDLVEKHFNAVTFGNELKPDALFNYQLEKSVKTKTVQFDGQDLEVPMVNDAGDSLDFSRADAMVDKILEWNAAHPDRKIRIRGHVLVWHSQTPEWFFHENYDISKPYVDKETMNRRLEWYISSVFDHYFGEAANKKYDGLFYGWDVVNEAVIGNTYRTDTVSPAESLDEIRHGNNSSWWHVYKSNEFIINAFKYANKYAPSDVELYYNDFGETDNIKSEGIIKLISDVKSAQGTRLDAFGMQAHYSVDSFSAAQFKTVAKKYAEAAGKVQLTELDFQASAAYKSGAASKESEYTKMAYCHKQLFDAAKDLKKNGTNVAGITVWGVIEPNSWLHSQSNVGGGADGSKQCPLLFDGKYKAKPAYWAYVDATKLEPLIQDIVVAEQKGDTMSGTEYSFSDDDTQAAFIPTWDKDGLNVLVSVKDATINDTDEVTVYVDETNSAGDVTPVKKTVKRSEAQAVDGGYRATIKVPMIDLKVAKTIGMDVKVMNNDKAVSFNDLKEMQETSSKYYAKATLKPGIEKATKGKIPFHIARVSSEQREVGNILLRLDDRLALPEEQAISYSTLNFEKYRGPQFHFKDTLLKTSKTISVHFNGKTMDKLLMVVKQKFDEKENKSFWHIELETLPYRNRESKGKYCITTFLHGMYYPDEDIFTHIDYTKNQYDIDTYLNKYSDCNEDMPIDTYTSSNELHYKIWCIEGGKYSRETWYRLMVVSLNQEYVELLDEILE